MLLILVEAELVRGGLALHFLVLRVRVIVGLVLILVVLSLPLHLWVLHLVSMGSLIHSRYGLHLVIDHITIIFLAHVPHVIWHFNINS